VVQIETRKVNKYRKGEERISIIKSKCQEGHPANENKQNSFINRCRFETVPTQAQ